MPYFLLTIYIALIGLVLFRTTIFKTDGLSKLALFFIFLSKILLGFSYYFIHLNYFNGGDTFLYYEEAKLISNTFWNHSEYYYQSIIGLSPEPPNAEVFTYPSNEILIKNFGTYALVHIHAFLNFVAFDSYELHIFFMAVVSFIASINFFKVFRNSLNIPTPFLITICFFFPSLSFWTAGLHKDGYIFLGMSLTILSLYSMQENYRFRQFFTLGIGLLIIALFRYYLLAIFAPALIAYILCIRFQWNQFKTYIFSYLIFSLILSTTCYLYTGNTIFELLSIQQQLFINEKGGSFIDGINPMHPSLTGFVFFIPTAIINVLARPFLWECKDVLQFISGIEILLFLTLCVFAFYAKSEIKLPRKNSITSLITAMATSNLMLIGLLVVNVGTIVRYRSIAIGLISVIFVNFLFQYKNNQNIKKKQLKQVKTTSNIQAQNI